MAYINGNYTCFTPELSLEVKQTDAKLISKKLPDLIEGLKAFLPPSGFDGFSSVKVEGVYYSEKGIPYTKETRFKNSPTIWGDYLPDLEAIIFDNCPLGKYNIVGLTNSNFVASIVFEENCNVILDSTTLFYPFETCSSIEFKGLNDDSDIEMCMWGVLSQSLSNLTKFSVFSGWNYDTVLCNSDLSAYYITRLINNLAEVEGKSLFLGSSNIEKVSEETINIAINKGWDVF
jgi:hypothetical protein